MDNRNEQNGGDGEAAASVHLGTRFTVEVENVLNGQLPYSTQALIEAMREKSTVTDLTLDLTFGASRTRARDLWQLGGQGLAAFLLQYITSRNHLRKLTFGPMLLFLFEPFFLGVQANIDGHSVGKWHDSTLLFEQFAMYFCSSPDGVLSCERQGQDLANSRHNHQNQFVFSAGGFANGCAEPSLHNSLGQTGFGWRVLLHS